MINIIDLILSIWDLGGQERFDFLKSQYFRGTAAIALCFDLSRPESFEKLDFYLTETRNNTGAGNIPILLVGTKSDLEEDLGEVVSSEQINNWMRTNQITDFIKTSAKTGFNIDQLFEKLSAMALIDLRDPPRPGEFRSDCIFRFKIVLVGAGGVGKTSIVHRFTEGVFASDYKLTVGVDFLTNKIQINENVLSEEILDKIKVLKEKTLFEAQKGATEWHSEEQKLQKEQMAREAQELFAKMDKLKAKYADEKTEDLFAEARNLDEISEQEEAEFDDLVLKEEKQASIDSAKDILRSVSTGSIDEKPKDQPSAPISVSEEKRHPPAGAGQSMPQPPGLPAPPQGRVMGPPGGPPSALFKKQKTEVAEEEPLQAAPAEASQPSVPGINTLRSEMLNELDRLKDVMKDVDEKEPLELPEKPMDKTTSDEKTLPPPPPSSVEIEKHEEKKKAKKEERRRERSDAKLSREESADIAGALAETETITVEKVLERKTTVFYRKQMNPMTHNKMSVILSSVKIYEQLKKKITEAQRAASDKTLKIKEASPFVEIQPVFPGCIIVPAMLPLDARKDRDTADFDITPIAVGPIKKACVRIYYEGQLIDTIPTPTKVVKQTAAKFGSVMGVILPVFGPLFDSRITPLLGIVPALQLFWNMIGGAENFFLLLSGITYVISSIFYILKKPKEAEPITAQFPSLDEILLSQQQKQND